MRKKITDIILVVILLAGVGLIAYPGFSDWWNSFHQTRAIAEYTATVANMDKEEFDRMWAEAEEFNKSLIGNPGRYTPSDEEKELYKSILDVTGTGIMGYIDIPSIKVSLPVYHGTDESILQIAIGHIEGTSFPVGGIGTHAAVSGHRGLPSAKLFTDIDQLKEGDRFLLQVLDRTLTYEVDQIRIVLPEELQYLEIFPDQDYCTLITCTPYGVNTHRLLVRGHRVENDDTDVTRITADAIRFEPIIVAPLVAAPILLVLLIILLISTSKWNRRRRVHKSKDEWKDLIETIVDESEANASTDPIETIVDESEANASTDTIETKVDESEANASTDPIETKVDESEANASTDPIETKVDEKQADDPTDSE